MPPARSQMRATRLNIQHPTPNTQHPMPPRSQCGPAFRPSSLSLSPDTKCPPVRPGDLADLAQPPIGAQITGATHAMREQGLTARIFGDNHQPRPVVNLSQPDVSHWMLDVGCWVLD